MQLITNDLLHYNNGSKLKLPIGGALKLSCQDGNSNRTNHLSYIQLPSIDWNGTSTTMFDNTFINTTSATTLKALNAKKHLISDYIADGKEKTIEISSSLDKNIFYSLTLDMEVTSANGYGFGGGRYIQLINDNEFGVFQLGFGSYYDSYDNEERFKLDLDLQSDWGIVDPTQEYFKDINAFAQFALYKNFKWGGKVHLLVFIDTNGWWYQNIKIVSTGGTLLTNIYLKSNFNDSEYLDDYDKIIGLKFKNWAKGVTFKNIIFSQLSYDKETPYLPWKQ